MTFLNLGASRPRRALARPGKFDLVNLLGDRHGSTRYLEICTPKTGGEYARVDRRRFAICERLMYLVPPRHREPLPIDYRFEGALVRDDPAAKRVPEGPYDVILVDPYHSYDCSYRDLALALSLVDEAGTVVVHDCCPRRLADTTPAYRVGPWAGLTYRAAVDFLLDRRDLHYCTVDSDSGCAMIRKRAHGAADATAGDLDPTLVRQWRACASDEDRFRFLEGHKRELLNLVGPEEFFAREGMADLARARLGRAPAIPRLSRAMGRVHRSCMVFYARHLGRRDARMGRYMSAVHDAQADRLRAEVEMLRTETVAAPRAR